MSDISSSSVSKTLLDPYFLSHEMAFHLWTQKFLQTSEISSQSHKSFYLANEFSVHCHIFTNVTVLRFNKKQFSFTSIVFPLANQITSYNIEAGSTFEIIPNLIFFRSLRALFREGLSHKCKSNYFFLRLSTVLNAIITRSYHIQLKHVHENFMRFMSEKRKKKKILGIAEIIKKSVHSLHRHAMNHVSSTLECGKCVAGIYHI